MTPQAAAYIEPTVDEAVWNAWLKKGHAMDQSDARRYKRVGGVFLALLLIAGAVSWFVPR